MCDSGWLSDVAVPPDLGFGASALNWNESLGVPHSRLQWFTNSAFKARGALEWVDDLIMNLETQEK
jgi:hypothetical protein